MFTFASPFHKAFWVEKCSKYAVIAQLVERRLPKPQVASSSLVYRSFENQVVILKKTAWFFIFQAPFSMVLSIIGRNLNWTIVE